jgi:hypothetical protein
MDSEKLEQIFRKEAESAQDRQVGLTPCASAVTGLVKAHELRCDWQC